MSFGTSQKGLKSPFTIQHGSNIYLLTKLFTRSYKQCGPNSKSWIFPSKIRVFTTLNSAWYGSSAIEPRFSMMLAAQVFTCANRDKKIGSSDKIIHLSLQTVVEKITQKIPWFRSPLGSHDLFRCQGPKLQRPQRPAQAAPMSTAHHGCFSLVNPFQLIVWVGGFGVVGGLGFREGIIFFGYLPGMDQSTGPPKAPIFPNH